MQFIVHLFIDSSADLQIGQFIIPPIFVMMKIKIYQIDAFAEEVFMGNSAAVCPLENWLEDDLLQKIAMENNLAETAFYVRSGDQYQIRWFTPTVEVDLCGHATLAAAYVLFNQENHQGDTIHFHSHRSGDLPVTKNGEYISLNFPVDKIEQIDLSEEINRCFDLLPKEAYKGKTDLMLIFDTEEDIKQLSPRLNEISKLDVRGVIVSAKGDEVDFVSRFFAPQSGIDEDPVTGSAYTSLSPYWSEKLGKNEFQAIQLSKRKGIVHCNLKGARVEISGRGQLYLKGEIFVG